MRKRTRVAGRWIEVEQGVQIRGRCNVSAAEDVRILTGSVIDAERGHLHLGRGAIICRYSIVETLGGKVSVGERSVVGDFCNLYGHGGLQIGGDCQIASGCRLVPKLSSYMDPTVMIKDQQPFYSPIIIGDDVWLGANVVVLGGVTIGHGAVVAANSVVKQDVSPMAVVGGAPARHLFFRGER